MLKLSREKLEVSTPYFSDRLQVTPLRIGDASVKASESAHNHGVIFDNNLDMSEHYDCVYGIMYAAETSQIHQGCPDTWTVRER